MPDKLQGRYLGLTDNSHTVIIMKTKGIRVKSNFGLMLSARDCIFNVFLKKDYFLLIYKKLRYIIISNDI